MIFWQFKFNMKVGMWEEFEKISRGEKFTQEANKKMMGCLGDIVFYYRTDKDKGIHFIAEIISEPYETDEYKSGYAIDLRIIKRLVPYYNDQSNQVYKRLQMKLNPMGIGAKKYLLKSEDEGSSLYHSLLENDGMLDKILMTINDKKLKKANEIKSKYIESGYLFNAFNHLNLIRGEVKHLAFIGNLLDPYGNHFKGDLFLKYFIQSLLGYEDLKDNHILKKIINDNPNVIIEKTIKNKTNTTIGRIDLWLESDNYIIAIEGKIEAKDNKGQLKKYDEYLQGQDKKYLLIYLTLNKGEEPEQIDIDKLYSFHLMNFEQDILDFIDYTLDDKSLENNIKNILFNYKDALIRYMFNFYLSFEYSYELIQEIAKDKKTFEQYQIIKEQYYQNKNHYKNTVIEDIAENFEYAKAYIERLFFLQLKEIIETNEMLILNSSLLSLNNDSVSIAKDIFLIDKARKRRVQPIIRDNKIDLGSVYINVDNTDEDLREYPSYSIINNCLGTLYDYVGCDIEALDLDMIKKLDESVFKSNNISKLLDEEFSKKLINTLLCIE